MWTGGCLNNSVNFRNDINTDFTNTMQRYGQYELQFIDRNSDFDSDWWDEDGVDGIIWDDDDLFLGIGPDAFPWTSGENKVWELYLISNDWKERTYFRWLVETATGGFVPTAATCDYSNPENPSWDACQGTIEILKLVWEDYWWDHDFWVIDSDGTQWDGIIDTWLIHPDYVSWVSNIIAGSNTVNYWQPIFPSSINITNFEIYAFPNRDLDLSWRDTSPTTLIAPYVQVKYTIEPSLNVKAKIIWESPSVTIATTISLSNLDIK